jgi:hypothetical protein
MTRRVLRSGLVHRPPLALAANAAGRGAVYTAAAFKKSVNGYVAAPRTVIMRLANPIGVPTARAFRSGFHVFVTSILPS